MIRKIIEENFHLVKRFPKKGIAFSFLGEDFEKKPEITARKNGVIIVVNEDQLNEYKDMNKALEGMIIDIIETRFSKKSSHEIMRLLRIAMTEEKDG